jgi:hypothetical protein
MPRSMNSTISYDETVNTLVKPMTVIYAVSLRAVIDVLSFVN